MTGEIPGRTETASACGGGRTSGSVTGAARSTGEIEVDSIVPISYAGVTPHFAGACGFKDVTDLLKVAKHGPGENVDIMRFRYIAPRRSRGTSARGTLNHWAGVATMPIWSIALLLAFAVLVPLLSVLVFWPFMRWDARHASNPQTGFPDSHYRVSSAWSIALVILYAGVGTFLALTAVRRDGVAFFPIGLAGYFYVYATYILLRLRSRAPENTYPLRLSPKQWKLLAGGMSLSALLGLISGMAGERIGWLWAFIAGWITAFLVAASRRTTPLDS